MAETSGIIVFTLWYLAIAFSYAMENYFGGKKDDEGRSEGDHNIESAASEDLTHQQLHKPINFFDSPLVVQEAVASYHSFNDATATMDADVPQENLSANQEFLHEEVPETAIEQDYDD